MTKEVIFFKRSKFMKNLTTMFMLSVASLSLAPVSYGMEDKQIANDSNHISKFPNF
jgi:hypothetical protein